MNIIKIIPEKPQSQSEFWNDRKLKLKIEKKFL